MNTCFKGGRGIILLALLLISPFILRSEIIIKTYQDENQDGLFSEGEELITGLRVTGFDESGHEYPFVDDGQGTFTLQIVPTRLRIQVEGYDQTLKPGFAGPTSVFFAEDGDEILVPVRTGLADQIQHLQVMIPCYEKGASESKEESPAFVSFPYDASGVAQMFGGDGPDPSKDANIAQIGSTWGVAYHMNTSTAIASTILKRHVGLGPGGLGAFYTIDYRTPTPTVSSHDLQGFTPSVGPEIDFGTIRRETIEQEVDSTKPYALSIIDERIKQASYDIDAFPKVAKRGYGDIDFTEDQQELWMVNTYQRSLISMDYGANGFEITRDALKNFPIENFPGLPSTDLLFRQCINVGSNSNYQGAESFTDANGTPWDRNKYNVGGITGYSDKGISNTMNAGASTSEKHVYQTWRRAGDFSFEIPVPKEETYTVTLHFSEPSSYVEGDRVFDVYGEGAILMEDFDIVKSAGGVRKAMTYTFEVDVTGPTLDLRFKGQIAGRTHEALVNGIEIVGSSLAPTGVLRPWGLTFHEGRGYLGLTNDASISQSRDHLFGYVVSFDPQNVEAGFTEELGFPLKYPRERSSNAEESDPQPLRTAAWLPWADTWAQTKIPTKNEPLSFQNGLLCSYPQPMISDINFTADGSMIIALMDRWAHQVGYQNYTTDLGDRTLIMGYASGDILKAWPDADSFDLERENYDPGVLYRGDDGPSYDGEFFHDDYYDNLEVAHHGELITGGMAIVPGTNEVLSTVHNPTITYLPHFLFDGVFTQGLHVYNTQDGSRIREYLFVDQFIVGKANGLGDIEFFRSAPRTEVGNYVWCDANANGIQDPTEYGIPGLDLMLLDKENSLELVGETTTDEGGNYLFTGLRPNNCYEIRVDLNQLRDLGFTGATAPLDAGADDMIDSDGDPDMVPGFAVAMFCTDDSGDPIHHIDFGFGGPSAIDALKLECEDPMTGCADFLLTDVIPCVDTTGLNTVRFFRTFNDADSMILANEITGTVQVCDGDSVIYARVYSPDDPFCFSIATVTLREINVSSAPSAFSVLACPAATYDAAAYLVAQGLSTPTFYTDAGLMNMVANPVPTPAYPTVVYFQATVDPTGCDVNGVLTIDSIPTSFVDAGLPTEICGLDCIDLTDLGAIFDANGTSAVTAQWSTNGTGVFDPQPGYSDARFYCPSETDMANGGVTLYLEVLDDQCGNNMIDSVTIGIISSTPRFLPSASDTILCLHPFVDDQYTYDTFPRCQLVANCGDTITATVIDYDLLVGNCDENIIKMIVRTQRVRYDKEEYFCMDTIHVLGLDFDNFVCPPERDSVYCHTGYLFDENGHPSPLETGVPMADTVPLWPQPNSYCDILVRYDDEVFVGECPMTIHRVWQIKNNCTGVYEECEQWIMIFDTVGPHVEKHLDKAVLAPENAFPSLDHPVIFVPTSSHDCEAHTYVPPIYASDTCSGVKLVKATIPGMATVVLTVNEESGLWESHENIKIPRSEAPIALIYEAYDNCHNITYDTCYFYVKDFTKPVPVCNKGINITVADTIAWLDANVFDEGSWDNCGVNMILARRSDWATACGVNLCDDFVTYCGTAHHDSLYCAVLETDKHINPVEAHYAKTLEWLCEDNTPCSDFILGGWWYDLIKTATLNCVDHPYPVDEKYLTQILQDPSLACLEDPAAIADLCYKMGYDFVSTLPEFAAPLFSQSTQTPFDIVKQIGGGWSKSVPFCCEDACQDVKVELLIMDYWCNWSTCWTTVYVEDKNPPEVVSDLFDVHITCTSYEAFYKDAVNQSKAGDHTLLDSLLGGYDKVSYDGYGNVPAKTPYDIYNIYCDSILISKDSLHYDEHFGYVWKNYSYYKAVHDTIINTRHHGQIADNCGLICIQDKPWVNIDACGNGYIRRTFKFIGQCQIDAEGHYVDTIVKNQTIWIQSDCEIQKSMFEVPEDVILYDCGITYDADGSGNASGVADPDVTGWPEYVFDQDCRQIGIGYYDKVFKVVGGDEACYKIVRTWCFADWCILEGDMPDGAWWFDEKYTGKFISCEQKIILLDTIAPVCSIDLADTVAVASCEFDLKIPVTVDDECGVLEYRWEVLDLKAGIIRARGSNSLNSQDSNSLVINVEDAEAGDYKFKIWFTDDCQNESLWTKEFMIIEDKKPTPICISNLTLELTPMDLNGDGMIDTAMGSIWAHEFNSSSTPACDGSVEGLQFRLDKLDGGAPALPADSADQLSFGCSDIGIQVLRMYVLDENGNWDYCEVVLTVQDNNNACGLAPTMGLLSGIIITENIRVVQHVDIEVTDPSGLVMMTDEDLPGYYRFDLLTGTEAYVKPSKDIDHVNGVSTADLIAIHKHIMGQSKLDSWYKERAADVTADGKISVADIVELRKLILAKIDRFSNNTSWRFFDRQTNQSKYHINPMQPEMRVDFTGVKVGDVNLDNDPAMGAPRSQEALDFEIPDNLLPHGVNLQVPVYARDLAGIEGFQFTLESDVSNVKINNIVGGSLDLSEVHVNKDHADEGWITVSWYDLASELSSDPNEPIFYLEVETVKEGSLREFITVNNRITPAEAYDESGLIRPLALADRLAVDSQSRFKLYQNRPNPFRYETVIGFEVPHSETVRLSIFDVTGRMLKTVEGEANRGYNEWNIDRSDLPSDGILYYRLDTKDHTAVKKMILMAQ